MNDMRVNGRTEIIPSAEGETLAALLLRYSVDANARGLAVAVNNTVVRRADWASRQVAAGDDVEIVQPFQGG